jgi:hypothetical protein
MQIPIRNTLLWQLMLPMGHGLPDKQQQQFPLENQW